MAWTCTPRACFPALMGGGRQKHVSALNVAVVTGCLSPGLKTTNKRLVRRERLKERLRYGKEYEIMSILNRDVVVVIKFVTSCVTAGFLIFFISALTGEDLLKNQNTIKELETLLTEISTE